MNFVLLKAVLPRFDPLALAATRFVCVGVLFELLLRRRGVHESMAREDRRVFVVSALLGYTLYQGAFILALHHSTVFSTSLMINTGPVWAGVGLDGWGAVAYSVVFPITVAVTLWNWAIGQQGVARTAVYQYLVPVVSRVLSWLVLAEGFGPRKPAGGVLILLGVALSRGR